LVAPAVTLLEQRQLRTGMRSLAAHNDPYPTRPRPSASMLGLLEPSQVQVSPAQQALRCFYAPFTPQCRERSGLTAPRKFR
jgi:hypothetical protein